MIQASDRISSEQARILLYSQRNLFPNFHYRLGLYEFEDMIQQLDHVDLISPEATRWFPNGTNLANRLATTYHVGINPGIHRMEVQESYDLFFAVAHFPKDLLHLNYVEGWRARCNIAICWLSEIWIPYIARTRYFLRTLRKFDYVIIQCAGSVKPIQEEISKPCLYLPYGIDAMLFCPYPNAPKRVIDVYSIGRRSEGTHRTLLRMAKNDGLFYVYDTINGDQVLSSKEHRLLVANLAKRSRYFIANPGKLDMPSETQGQIEFGSRFFEGAASGAIMIGETPRNEQFSKVFDWTDAVIHLPFGSGNIDAIINELDKDPQRQETIRRNNIAQSLMRHDWAYRWEAILKMAGLQPMPELLERKQRLVNLARMVEESTTI